jgi:preprotein translocase subunit YajC
MMVIFAAVFYFMIWRPQAKRTKDHKNLMASLSKGDEVVTSGGIIGRISKVSDDFVTLTLAEGVETHFQKAAVASVLPKGTIKSI